MSAGWQVRQRRLSCRVSRIKALSIGLSAKRGCGQRERKIAAKHMKRWQWPVLAGGWNSSARHAVVGNGRNEVAEVRGGRTEVCRK